MSTQASKAVKDLVDTLFEDLPEDDVRENYWKSRCADLIQSSPFLADLLEKARAVNDPDLKRFMALQEALEPWKATE